MGRRPSLRFFRRRCPPIGFLFFHVLEAVSFLVA